MKKVRGVIKDNYLYCGHCGASSVKKDEKGKIVLSGAFVTVENGYGINFSEVKSVYCEELGKELTELTCTCAKCNYSNVYLTDISEGKRYSEIGDIKEIKEEEYNGKDLY